MKPVILKSKFGQVLGWVLWLVLLVSTIIVGLTEGIWPLFQTAAVTAFVGASLHLILIRPRVIVDDSGVKVVNPLRDFKVNWTAIDRIDTKWGLTLFTASRKIQAWSAPAPGRHSSLRFNKFEGRHLPESSYLAGTIRPGDLVSSDSGAAAYTIRSEWERRRDLGLFVGKPEVMAVWNKPWLVALAASMGIALLANLS